MREAQQCTDDRPAQGGDDGGEFALDDLGLDGRQLAEAAHRRQAALQDGGQRGFVELDDDLGARDARGDGGGMGGDPLGEGLREVAARAGVDDGPVAPAALQARGQRPRARRPAP